MLRRRTATEDSRHAANLSRRDHGVTFIEILVAVVLLGTAVVSTLAALRVTVIGTRLERDHSRAHTWLQSATEALQTRERVGCDPVGDPPTVPDIEGLYESTIRSGASSPPGWDPPSQLDITDIRFWDGSGYQSDCFDDAGFRLQLVTIEVTSPDGEILETVSVVKDTPDLPVEEEP